MQKRTSPRNSKILSDRISPYGEGVNIASPSPKGEGFRMRLLTSNMAFVGVLLICAGFIIAERTPAPQSIGVALIFLHPFFNRGIKKGLQNIIFNKYAIAMAIYYLLILLSIFHFGNLHLYSQLVLMQIPLIFIPFGLSDPDAISHKKRDIVFITLITAVIIAGVASFVNYLL